MTGKHAAPTNKPCTFIDPLNRGFRCVRYDGHPANLYGVLGHRMKRPLNEPVVFRCTRADLASLGRRSS